MASITLLLKGSSDPRSIYLRFTEGKIIDLKVNTHLCVQKAHWDAKNKRIRNLIDVPNRDEVNSKLAKLQIGVIDQYNIDYSNGVAITSKWLNAFIKSFFGRPQDEVVKSTPGYEIYLVDFCDYWLKEKAPKYKVKANKYMDEITIRQYRQVVNNLEKFIGNRKTKLTETDSKFMDDFSNFLTEKENYSHQTAKRKVGRVKFFIERAEGEDIKVHRGYKERVFVQEEATEYKHPYLNESEINKIYNLDLSHDKTLDNVRDNFIIGLRTALRISDFLTRLSIENIDGDFIEIKTKKTGHSVAIPLHAQVREILKKRRGHLPDKISEPKFNKFIKILGQIAEIDQMTIGGINISDPKTKKIRKEVGTYKKYELFTSHICRRSFATNLFGKVSNSVIMAVAGWKSESQMLHYIKMTNMESAEKLKEYWEESVK